MFRNPDDLDIIRDGLALIESAHHQDLQGARAILDNCQTRLVAMFLARVAADLVEDLADDAGEMLGWLRDRHVPS